MTVGMAEVSWVWGEMLTREVNEAKSSLNRSVLLFLYCDIILSCCEVGVVHMVDNMLLKFSGPYHLLLGES